MWTTVALATALSLAPQQAGSMSLTNVRTTYGAPGIVRPDSKLLPGDQLTIAFDIEGITVDPNGRVLYSMATECCDSKGKCLHAQEPRDLETIAALGGKSVPAYVQLDVGLDQPPGDYTVKVTVTDRAGKASQTLTRGFQVLPAGFGLVRLGTTADPEGHAHRSSFEVGSSLWVNTGVVGFGRDKAKGQPDVALELRVLDEKGQPTMSRPFTGGINDKVPANARFLPAQFLVALNRPGKFTVEVKATCMVTKKSATLSFPVSVASPK